MTNKNAINCTQLKHEHAPKTRRRYHQIGMGWDCKRVMHSRASRSGSVPKTEQKGLLILHLFARPQKAGGFGHKVTTTDTTTEDGITKSGESSATLLLEL
jgi:hypothetical protein